MFAYCQRLKKISIPYNITSIGNFVFSNCGIQELRLHENIKSIGKNSCYFCSQLTYVDLGRIKKIPSRAFQNCEHLKKVKMSDLVEQLDDSCFGSCWELSEIHLSTQLKRLKHHCFRECKSLKEIELPSSVQIIERGVFDLCTQMEKLIIPNPQCFIYDEIIEHCLSITQLQIPLINSFCCWYVTENEKEVLKRNTIKFMKQNYEPLYYMNEKNELKSIEIPLNDDMNLIPFNQKNSQITSVYFPSTVTSIGRNCLYTLKNINNIFLPSTIIDIHPFAFFGCNELKSIIFENKSFEIKRKTDYKDYKKFVRNGLQSPKIKIYYGRDNEMKVNTKITLQNCTVQSRLHYIPSTFVCIQTFKFLHPELRSLTIPSTLEKIEANDIHQYLPYLQELKLYKKHAINTPHFIDNLKHLKVIEVIDGTLDDIIVSFDFHLYMKERGIELNTVDIDKREYRKYGMILPSVVKSLSFYSNDNYRNENLINDLQLKIRKVDTSIQSIQLPSYISIIEEKMFKECHLLKSIDLSQISEIKMKAFNRCKSLTSIQFSSKLKHIGYKSFYKCSSLQYIQIPSSVTSIESNCFGECILLTAIDSSNEIDGKCILNCQKLEIIPPLHSLEINNFNSCHYLSKVILNETITEIPPCCFMNCHSLKDINIPFSCTKIGFYAFKHCISLKSIECSSNMKKIGKGVFYNCSQLKSVSLSESNIHIGYDCFGECSSLKEIFIGNEKLNEYPFEVSYKQKYHFQTIGIECNNVVMRKDDINQFGVRSLYKLMKEVKRIEDNCFRNNEDLKEIIIPNNITELGQFSFANCYNLTKIIIPSTITMISFHCFDECINLKEIQLPQQIHFESKCFWNCLLLKDNSIIPKEYIEN